MNPLAIFWFWRIGVALVLVGLITVGYFGWRSHERGIGAAPYIAQIAQIKAAGDAAQQAANEKTRIDISRKRMADDENKLATDALNATVKRLRDANPPSSHLPPAPAATSRPDLICLDRAEYQREDGAALEKLFTGARSLADEGTKSTVDLDTAKKWATK